MKTLMITLAMATLVFLGIAAAPNAHPSQPAAKPPCTSLFARLTDAFDEVVRTMVSFRVDAANAMVGDEIPFIDLEKISDDVVNIQIRAYELVGEIVGDKGTPGPVNLTVPFKNFRGSCYTERTFRLAVGPWDHVKVSFKKTGGKNGAHLAICKYDVNDNYITTKYIEIDKGSETAGVEKTITMKGMKNDKYLTIHLVAEGGPTNKVDYKLKVTGEFDYDKLAKDKTTSPTFVPQTKTVIKR